MCLILFSFHAHPGYALIVAANRDEAYERPAAPADFWTDHPHVHGGRDLEQGGTWLGLTRGGRFAAVTNFREGGPRGAAPRSRGELAGEYLSGNVDAGHYLAAVRGRQDQYNGFCVLAGDLCKLFFLSNRGNGIEPVAPGIHGLSNHLLDTPWPKVTEGCRVLAGLVGLAEEEITATLFGYLAQRAWAADAALPETGVGRQRERELSPAFIAGDRYGTRASTLVLVGNNGNVRYLERSFGPAGVPLGVVDRRFTLESRAKSSPGA